MANIKFSQFAVGGQLQPSDIIVGLRSGVNTQFSSPNSSSGPFLLKSDNLSDVADADIAFVNLGTSNGTTLTLTESDFVAGEYTITNPGPLILELECNTPGSYTVILPEAQGTGSYALGLGPRTVNLGSVEVFIKVRPNISQLRSDPDTGYDIFLTDKSTQYGTWDSQPFVSTVNGDSLNVVVDLQSAYDSSSNGNIEITSETGNFGFSGTEAGFYLPAMTEAQFEAIATPPNGLMAWNQDDDRITLNKGTSGSPVYDEVAYVSDITSLVIDAIYAEVFFQNNATPTNIVTMGVPVKVGGTYLAGQLSSGTITSTSTDTRIVNVIVSLTASMNLVTANLTFTIFQNGSAVAKSAMSMDLDGVTPSETSRPISCLLSVALGDTIELRVQNNTSTDDPTIEDLNFAISAIGGTGSTTTIPTWEQTYTAGDGTVTMTTGKPIDVQSADNAIIPTIQTTQTEIPTNGLVVGQYSSWANGIRYGLVETTVQTLATSSQNRRAGLSNSLSATIATYTGSNNTERYSALLTQGPNNQGVVTAVASVSVPTTSYANIVALYNMWQTIVGTPQITANSFAIGDCIEIVVTGDINMTAPDASTVSTSYFNVNVSGLFDLASNNVNLSSFPASYNGIFQWRFTITRQDSTTLNIAGSGLYTDIGNVIKPIIFHGENVTGYSASTTYAIAVNWQKGVTLSGGGTYNYIARGLTMKQYS